MNSAPFHALRGEVVEAFARFEHELLLALRKAEVAVCATAMLGIKIEALTMLKAGPKFSKAKKAAAAAIAAEVAASKLLRMRADIVHGLMQPIGETPTAVCYRNVGLMGELSDQARVLSLAQHKALIGRVAALSEQLAQLRT